MKKLVAITLFAVASISSNMFGFWGAQDNWDGDVCCNSCYSYSSFGCFGSNSCC